MDLFCVFYWFEIAPYLNAVCDRMACVDAVWRPLLCP
jgi:hypothetical protein